MVLVLSSLSVGIRESSRESLERVGADFYVVAEDLHPLLMDLQRFDQGWSVEREIRNSDYTPDIMSPRLTDALFFDTGKEKGEVIALGIVPGMEKGFDQFILEDGEWFEEQGDPVRDTFTATDIVDFDLFTYEVLISSEFQSSTGLDIGDEFILSSSLVNGTDFSYTVVGTFTDSLSRLSRSIIMHLGELQLMKGLLNSDTLTEILLSYEEEIDPDEMEEWSTGNEFAFKDIVDIIPKENILNDIRGFLSIIDGFSSMVIGVTLIVCLVFTSTIFLISSKERFKDTAILRAIGIPAHRIFQWVIMESSFFYLLGTLGGFILGSIIIWFLNSFLIRNLSLLPVGFVLFRIDIFVIGATLLASFLLSLLSSLVPALRTSLKPPMETFRGDVS